MGDIGQRALLGRDERSDALRHVIELTAQVGQLVMPAAQLRRNARFQISLSKRLDHGLQLLYRRSEVEGQEVANYAGNQNTHGNARSGEEGRRSAGLAETGDKNILPAGGGNNKPAPRRAGGAGK